MSTPSATRYDLRLLVCMNCGAPFESPPAGGHCVCTYCRAAHEIAPRDERPETFSGGGALGAPRARSEEERFAVLLEQMHSTHPYNFPPEALRNLARNATDASRLPEVERLFREAEARAQAGAGFDAEVALFWTAGILRTMYLTQRDYLRARAVDETALETLTDPVLRTVQRAALANRACEAGDLESARAWLAPCPRDSEVLAVHTHVRLTEARIALLEGDFTRVLDRVGAEAEQVPLRIDRDAMACLYRAAAYEGLGRVDDAKRALFGSHRHIGGKVFALNKLTSLRDAWPQGELCKESFPWFRRRVLLGRLGCAGLVILPLGAGVAWLVLQFVAP